MTVMTIGGHRFLIRSEREEDGEQALYAIEVDDHGEILDPYPVAGGIGYTYRSIQVDLEADYLGDADVDEAAFDDEQDDSI